MLLFQNEISSNASEPIAVLRQKATQEIIEYLRLDAENAYSFEPRRRTCHLLKKRFQQTGVAPPLIDKNVM